jgi:hypothetical protein
VRASPAAHRGYGLPAGARAAITCPAMQIEERRKVRTAKRRIQAALVPRGVLRGLSDPQIKKLIDRIWFIDHMSHLQRQFTAKEKRARRFFERGPGQLRLLRSRLARLRAALLALQHQLTSICGDETTVSGSPYLAGALHASGLPERVSAIMALARDVQPPTDAVFDHGISRGVSVQPLKEWVTPELFKLLTTECGIGKNDATQRIARIENALWGGNVQETDPDSHTPDRSSAIQKRLKRNAVPRRR